MKRNIKILIFVTLLLLTSSVNALGYEIKNQKNRSTEVNITDNTYEESPTYYGSVSRYNADWPGNDACKIYMHKKDIEGTDKWVCVGKSLLDDLFYSHNLGLLQWDISSIPDDKYIYNAKIRIYVSSLTEDPYRINTWDENKIKLDFRDIDLKNDLSNFYDDNKLPLEFDTIDYNDELRNDAIGGEFYGETPDYLEAGDGFYPSEDQFLELSKSAVSDLQRNLEYDRFTLGIDVILKDFSQDEYASGIVLFGGRSQLQVNYGETKVAPEEPSKPSGKNELKIDKEYDFTTNSHDPQGEDIYYLWDWGDNSYYEKIGPYPNGDTCTATHTWKEEASSFIRVKAIDSQGYESEWSEPFTYVTPKSKTVLKNLVLFGFLGRINNYLNNIILNR